jgi:hypothetical protein
MAWTYIPGSGKISLEGVEFGLTNGTETRRCFISQQEIDRWAAHVGKIDQHIAFELPCALANEIDRLPPRGHPFFLGSFL